MALDLDLAISLVAPGAAYLPDTDRTAIVEWRDPRPEPTAAQLRAAYDAWVAQRQQALQDATATAEQIAATTDLRDQYATALARLDQIIGATTFTNAQVAAAVQDEARILRRVLRLLKDALAP